MAGERAREAQRLAKLLEDAGIKVDSVASDIQGVSARAMIEALIAGERDPKVLADLARTRLRARIPELREALVGRFDDHHALLARMYLDHIDALAGISGRLDEEIDRLMGPFAEPAARLAGVPGIGQRVAQVIVAEIGVDMSRFPTAAHLASWAGLCPGNHESAGKRFSGRTTKGNPALRGALCEAAWAASHTKDTYLAAQYRRFQRRFGKNNHRKAAVAVAHSLLVIVWHLLHHGGTYQDLGGDYLLRQTRRRRPQALPHRRPSWDPCGSHP